MVWLASFASRAYADVSFTDYDKDMFCVDHGDTNHCQSEAYALPWGYGKDEPNTLLFDDVDYSIRWEGAEPDHEVRLAWHFSVDDEDRITTRSEIRWEQGKFTHPQ